VTPVTNEALIAPHGGRLVDRMADRPAGLEGLERVTLSDREQADLEMLASGALSPLEGFMASGDYDSVLDDMRLAGGVPWTLPVCLAVDWVPHGESVALLDRTGRPLATLEVEEVFTYDKVREAERCFGTTDSRHPGVARVYRQKQLYLAGPVSVFERPRTRFPELALDPAETRRVFSERGWRHVVGFQTRNPIHRAHEYLTKAALERVDGLLLHPLIGETKADDLPAEIRVESYRVLLRRYYPPDRVLLATFPAAMRYAGPREAIWHAICRKNYGCSHFIVGRDHAGVGTYYGRYDAQRIFERFHPRELGVLPMVFDQAFHCRTCAQMATDKTCPHPSEDRLLLSGTSVRELLSRGQRPPMEFARPEVADVLMAAYADGNGDGAAAHARPPTDVGAAA
jgi:sulfate adenylyltransferase